MNAADLAHARSFLFVPGDRPDRFAKAAAGGADVVILDLEDAVAEDRKVVARQEVRLWLDAGHAAIVRVNAAGTPWYQDDLRMAAGRAGAVMVPKAEERTAMEEAARQLGEGTSLIPLIETAKGVLRAEDVCAAASVARSAFGSVDLAAQLGVDHRDRKALQHARCAVVLAAAAAGCAPPLDGVTTALDDEEMLGRDLRHARRLGFTARLCIHPRQVAATNQAFTPGPEEVARARAIVAAGEDGAAVLGGEMIDRPVRVRARSVLERAARAG